MLNPKSEFYFKISTLLSFVLIGINFLLTEFKLLNYLYILPILICITIMYCIYKIYKIDKIKDFEIEIINIKNQNINIVLKNNTQHNIVVTKIEFISVIDKEKYKNWNITYNENIEIGLPPFFANDLCIKAKYKYGFTNLGFYIKINNIEKLFYRSRFLTKKEIVMLNKNMKQ